MKVAFVAPFFGARASGGAEAECRETAIRLAADGVGVDVLTTCALDLVHDWNVQFHAQGVSLDEGVTVRRFRTNVTDLGPLADLNQRLLGGEELTPEEERRFAAHHVNSFELLRYLDAHQGDYDRVFFIPYLFGTTLYGSRICPEKAVLIPCLHDEPYARIQPVVDLFARVARIVFHTQPEADLAAALYGDAVAGKGSVVGEGVDMEFESSGDRFRKRFNIHEPFLFYAGRKDASKNVGELVLCFERFKRLHPGPLKLVMVGPGRVALPDTGDIVDLGFVTTQEKRDAFAAASVFVQPSLNESFSIVLMEAWSQGIPALVHGQCAVMKDHAVRSGGALYFTTAQEFEGCLLKLLGDADLSKAMGEAGRCYARTNFEWPRIIRRYRDEVL